MSTLRIGVAISSGLGIAFRYEARVLRRAFGDTKTLYGWGCKTILLVVLPSVLTIALDFLRLDDAEFQRHLLTVAYGLLAPVIVALLIFLWNFFC